MQNLTISNIPADVHERLRELAISHGRSLEAEARAILIAMIKPEIPFRMGEALWKLLDLGPEDRLTEEEWRIVDGSHKRKPAEPTSCD